jgi:hypothetical protein
MPTHSEVLQAKLALVLPYSLGAAEAVTRNADMARVYPDFLFTLHCMVRATVPMMEAALERSRALAPQDPVCAVLAPYLERHIPEERGHDEWIMEDLETVGVPRAEVWARRPDPGVAALIGAQYYWIFHRHPVALMGYMEIAEGYPPTLELVERLKGSTGFPDGAFRSLRRHARLDLAHREELRETLDALPLEPWHAELVGTSALESAVMAGEVFGRLANGHAA